MNTRAEPEFGHVEKRAPEEVMRLARMGASFPTRLSFMRTVIRELHNNDWTIAYPTIALDDDGYGHIVITATGPKHTYSLIAYSHELDPEKRTDRVIAEAWDATFTLYDGIPADADIERLRSEVPRQEAGRCSPNELTLSRANKSVRLFTHVVDSLAAGKQPDIEFVSSVGYLMRTTAVYGNGKFGIADRAKFANRPEVAAPFQAELLSVYLIRCFTHLLVEHIARARSPETFVPLAPEIKRFLGIGNSTGLGMAPFMHSHPVLINNWVDARETAVQRVRNIRHATAETMSEFRRILARAHQNIAEWNVADERQTGRIEILRPEVDALIALTSVPEFASHEYPWDHLYQHAAEHCSLEAQELVAALILEPHGDLIDDLATTMSADTDSHFDASVSLESLHRTVRDTYGWALEIDLETAEAEPQFWYVSEEKLEPRLGERASETGVEKEMPLHVVRDVQALVRDLSDCDPKKIVAEFLMAHPQHRHIVKRIQTVARYPFGEIRDNLVGPEMLAIDLLRFKLAFFGATKFDPKSDRWTRINMYQGAPLPDELANPDADDWAFATMPADVAT
ncbi:MAG: hypothetical protein ACR2O4_05855 [Hyphomicrobiaceae bacterium]